MLHTVAAVLLFLLPTRACSQQLYLHPPVSRSGQPAQLLAQHLGLDAFFSAQNNHGETVLGTPQAFVGEGLKDALIIAVDAHAQDVIPEYFRPAFTLGAPLDLEQYKLAAQRIYHTTIDGTSESDALVPPSAVLTSLDTFALSSSSSTLQDFVRNFRALISFIDAPSAITSDRFALFNLTLSPTSPEYNTVCTALKAAIQSAASKRIALAVVLTSSAHPLHARQPPQSPLPLPSHIPDTAPVFSTRICHTSAAACSNATSSCSSRGSCAPVTRAGRTCFVCECTKKPLEEGGRNVSWAGEMCQKKDISVEFTLLLGTVLTLLFLAGGSTMLLYGIGGEVLPGVLVAGGGVGVGGKH